jgi:hypothetical protein
MKNRWLALAVVLTLALMPRDGSAQSTGTTRSNSAGSLRQNYPNPFNPETRSDFWVDESCVSGASTQHRVSVKIYNILSQLVAVPVLQGSAGSVAGGQPLDNVLLPGCSSYTWYWNGNYRNTSQEAASGVYLAVLEVDGKRVDIKRMLNAK